MVNFVEQEHRAGRAELVDPCQEDLVANRFEEPWVLAARYREGQVDWRQKELSVQLQAVLVESGDQLRAVLVD